MGGEISKCGMSSPISRLRKGNNNKQILCGNNNIEPETEHDMENMKAVMQNPTLQKEFCFFATKGGKFAYFLLFQELQCLRMKIEEQYPDVLPCHLVATKGIKFPTLSKDITEDCEMKFILRRVIDELERLRKKKRVPFATLCSQITRSEEILLHSILEEFRQFVDTPVYKKLTSFSTNDNNKLLNEEEVTMRASKLLYTSLSLPEGFGSTRKY